MGEMMDGIKLECNIYTFENAEHYISQLKPFNEESGVCCHKVNEIIEKIKVYKIYTYLNKKKYFIININFTNSDLIE